MGASGLLTRFVGKWYCVPVFPTLVASTYRLRCAINALNMRLWRPALSKEHALPAVGQHETRQRPEAEALSMSDTASSPALAQGSARQRIGWPFDLILLLLVLASRPGPSLAQCAFYSTAGVLDALMAWIFGFAALIMPAAVMLAMGLRLVTGWSKARPLRRVIWIGMILLCAAAMPVKRPPWVPLAFDTYVSRVLPSERAYLYGFRMRVQCCIDVQAIRTWARDNRGFCTTEMSDAFAAGQVPACVKWLGPWSASVAAPDSTAVFDGIMVWLPERWILVVCQEDGHVPDFDMEALPVAPGVWLTWGGEYGAAP